MGREPRSGSTGASWSCRGGLGWNQVQVTDILKQSQGRVALLARAGDAHAGHLDDHRRCAARVSVRTASSARRASASISESGAPLSARTALPA